MTELWQDRFNLKLFMQTLNKSLDLNMGFKLNVIAAFTLKGSPSVQHIISTQKGHSFSAPKIPQFHNKNPLVQPQKPLSLTPKIPLFHTPHSSRHTFFGSFLVWNWGVCWTEGFWVLERCGPSVELRGVVWNWGALSLKHIVSKIFYKGAKS